MGINLDFEEIRYKEPVLRKRFAKEETTEIIVPDTQPDALRVIGAVCMPYLRSKDAETGRVTVAGAADIAVLYIPESGGTARRISANVPFSAQAEGGGITESSLIVCNLSVISSDARMLNSRKMTVRFEIEYYVECYEGSIIRTVTGAEGADNIEILIKEREAVLPSAVNEKTFTLTDTQSIGGLRPGISEIFAATVRFFVDETRAVGSKAVVKGSADTQITYRTTDGDISAVSFQSPFSQIVELDISEEAAEFDVSVTATGAYVSPAYSDDSAADTVSIELHAVAQCVSFNRFVVRAVTDAYSTSNEMELSYTEICLRSLERFYGISENVSCSFDTAQDIKYIGGAAVNTGIPGMQGGRITLPASIRMFYTSRAEELFCLVRNTEVTAQAEPVGEADTELRSQDVNSSLIEYNITPQGAAVRFPVFMRLRTDRVIKERIIESMEICEDKPKDASARPPLVAYRVSEGDTLWKVSKRYNALRENIKKANQLGENGEIETGQLILIPGK